MKTSVCETHWARIYIAGPIEVAKQLLREECMREGLCITIEPTHFIYTGAEEAGYVVGFNNYPRFPWSKEKLAARAEQVLVMLVERTFQHSAMLQLPDQTLWFSRRPENA